MNASATDPIEHGTAFSWRLGFSLRDFNGNLPLPADSHWREPDPQSWWPFGAEYRRIFR